MLQFNLVKVRFLLVFILLLAAFLRLFWLSQYPAGFTPDEASFGYDAYSILKTGKDQWGESFPLAFRSFGDFKAPLYTYLTIPSVAIFGLSEFAVRLPNAILGVLVVLVVYFLVMELFKSLGGRRVLPFAMLSALFLAISPWHVSLSRGAFEANLTTFLMPLGVLAFLKGLPVGGQGLRDGRWMVVAAFAFGLNLFSYHSARLITPLLLVGLIWFNRQRFTPLRNSVTRYRRALVVFLTLLLIAGYTLLFGAGARGADIGIFNPTGGWGAVSDRRYEAVQSGLSDGVARMFSNKAIYVAGEFTKNYLSYLSPTFLFTQGAGEATYGMIPGLGVLYVFELPFIFAALWFFIKRPNWGVGFILAWVLLAPIPAALTKGPGFAANRAAIMMPAIQILSAYGAMILWEWYRKLKVQSAKLKVLIPAAYGIFALGGVLFFLENYIYHAPGLNAPSMSFGWKDSMKYINSSQIEEEEIIVARGLSEPHIFVAFYNRWNPADYQRQSQDFLRYEEQGLLFVDQLGEYYLGNYTFRNLHYPVDQNLSSVILIGRAQDFPVGIVAQKVVEFPNGKPAHIIIETSDE